MILLVQNSCRRKKITMQIGWFFKNAMKVLLVTNSVNFKEFYYGIQRLGIYARRALA